MPARSRNTPAGAAPDPQFKGVAIVLRQKGNITMQLGDYKTPDPYAPDPRASQRVAAQKRQRPAHDTEPIVPIALPSRRYAVPFGIGALVLIALMIVAASYQLSQLPSARPLQVTPGPSTAAFLAAPSSAPAPTPAATAAIRTISAYAAPDGLLLGQIELDRMMTPIAHYGGGWIQADVAGSGVVWLRASDVPDLALIGPDLAPVASQPQTGRGLTVDDATDPPPPEATPVSPPAEPTASVVWPTSAPAKAPDFVQPSVSDRCKFITCLGQQAVNAAHEQACHALYWQYGDSESIPEPDLSAVRQCTWEGLYR